MKDDEFIAAIRQTSGIDDVEQVKKAAAATVTVLSQRLTGGQPSDIAGQLPPIVADAMPDQGGSERFSLDEFYRRVAEAEGVSPYDARRHARSVMSTVISTVGRSQWKNIVAQLPSDYADLVFTGPVSH